MKYKLAHLCRGKNWDKSYYFFKYVVSTFILQTLLLSSCLDVASIRSKQENQVGSKTVDGISVKVKNGLATIRSLVVDGDQISLWLWVQAPNVEITIEYEELSVEKELELKMSNVMNDSSLQVEESVGQQRSSKSIVPQFIKPTVLQTTIAYQSPRVKLRLLAPIQKAEEEWKFAVFADVQERINGLADLLQPLGKEDVKFALISGDLTSMGKTHELELFQEEMERHLPFPCYATLGNHELGTEGIPFYHYFGRGSFNFTYGGAMFSLIDGASATIAKSTYQALMTWLERGRNQLHIFITHIPIIDPDGSRGGAYASRLDGAHLLGQLKQYRVDYLIYGHVHTYRQFSQANIPALISGGGGSIPMRLDGIGRHYVIFSVQAKEQTLFHRIQRIYPEE